MEIGRRRGGPPRFPFELFWELQRAYDSGPEGRAWESFKDLRRAAAQENCATILGHIDAETAKNWLGWGLGQLYAVGYRGSVVFCAHGGFVVIRYPLIFENVWATDSASIYVLQLSPRSDNHSRPRRQPSPRRRSRPQEESRKVLRRKVFNGIYPGARRHLPRCVRRFLCRGYLGPFSDRGGRWNQPRDPGLNPRRMADYGELQVPPSPFAWSSIWPASSNI